jgi:DNA-binding FadR family transcriptional regulator
MKVKTWNRQDPDKYLEYIKAYKSKFDGISPTWRELAAEFNTSKSVVGYVLRQLENDGKIRLVGNGKIRGIMVVGGEWRMQA